MRSKPHALAITAALLCAGRLGATLGAEAVPTISVVEPPAPPAVAETPAVRLKVPAPRCETATAGLRFAISTTSLQNEGPIQVRGIAAADAPSAVREFRFAADVAAPPAVPPAAQSSPTPKESPVSFSVPRYTATLLERETVAACLVLEAASQGEFGMRAVMAVIRNRAHGLPELFAPTVLAVKQFSALNRMTAGLESLASVIGRARRDRTWPVALAIVERAMDESWNDPTDGATHYTRSGERTRWTRRLAKTTTIGAHSFYR